MQKRLSDYINIWVFCLIAFRLNYVFKMLFTIILLHFFPS